MPFEAVSAYTVLVGEAGSAATVSVHGSADEAWRALDAAVRSRSRRWMPRHADPATLADRWRAEAPERRFWQVSAHQLQVMVPASCPPLSRPGDPSAAGPATRTTSASRPRWRWRHRRRPQPTSSRTT